MPSFSLNNAQSIRYIYKLEKLHRSAFPSAVRNTLSEAAIEMKKGEILKSSISNFKTVRSKSFFKKYTAAERAKGFNIPSMKSRVGFYNKDGNIAAETAIRGMEEHETGGKMIGGNQYLADSRTSNSLARKVRKKNIYSRANVISTGSRSGGRFKSQAAKNSAMIRKGFEEKKSFWLNTKKGSYLASVKSYNKKNPRKTKLRFLMRERDKPVVINKNSFMTKAANNQAKKMPQIFKEKAEFQIKKYMK